MVPSGTVDILLAGINHLEWVTDIRHAATGEDLYPLVRETIRRTRADQFPAGYRFIFEASKLLGFVCSPADNHVADYLWFIDPPTAERCGLKPYPVDKWFGGLMANDWEALVAKYDTPAAIRKYVSQRRIGWMSVQIARSLMTAGQKYFPALNLLNRGAISNLSDDIVVEDPGGRWSRRPQGGAVRPAAGGGRALLPTHRLDHQSRGRRRGHGFQGTGAPGAVDGSLHLQRHGCRGAFGGHARLQPAVRDPFRIGPLGDWSIFRRVDIVLPEDSGRKMDLSPFRPE